jgi:penicillin-binding protein 1A
MWTRFVVLPLAAAFGLAVAGLLAVGLVVVLAYPQLPSLEALTAYQPKIPLRI